MASLALAALVLLLGGYALYRAYRPASSSPRAARDPAARPESEVLPARPNVVLLTIDTLRADRLSCYGSSPVATPALDALAAEGIRFAHAATTVPFTLPAHSSLMTGTYPPFHGVRENVGYVLDDRLPTLAERLAAGGWATGGFVSAFVLDARWGIARGFDTYFDDFDPPEGGSTNLGSVQRDGADTLSEAVRWLDVERSAPFFLWLHLFDPHDPYEPPEPYRSRYAHPYDGEVAYVDSLVAKLRLELEARGLLDNTLLVVTGDHGEGLGQHGEGFHGFFVYDSTVHVPLIVRLPGGRQGGRVVEEAVSHVDLLPTLLEAAGQPIPAETQGRSLLHLLRGEEDAEGGERRAVYTESLYPLLHYGWAPLRAVRSGRYKLIEAPAPELYDLSADPEEKRNVVREERGAAGQLRDRLAVLRRRIERAAGQAPRAELDAGTLEQLQALGYAAGRGGVSVEEEGELERADPKDRIRLHQLVMAAQGDLGAGRLDRAVERLEKALAADPTIVDAHQMLGVIALRREQPEVAIVHFQATLERRRDHPAALFGLADAYRELGRTEEALLGYELILTGDPTEGRALLSTAALLVAAGRAGEARERLARAAAGGEVGPLVQNRLGELLALEGRASEAIAAFRRAVEANEALVPPRFNLAVLLEEQGRAEEAMGLYQAAIDRAPRHYQAQFNLGRLYGQRGDLERQQALYEAALVSEPEFARGYFFLAKLLMDRGGDLERAEALAREGLARDPEHRAGPLGYYVLADVLNRQGRPRAAASAAAEGRRLQAEMGAGP